jgi:2-keto-4-pentenoate hydratase
MPSPAELDALAQQMLDAQEQAAQIEPFTSRIAGFDLAAGYALAERVHRLRELRGERLVGRKIGFTNRDGWPALGVSAPIWAPLFSTTVQYAERGRASCRLARFPEPKIEPEIVVHFARAPAPEGDVEALLAAIDWLAAGFEIVHTHYPGWCGRAADTLADSSHHAALIVGEPRPLASLGADPAARLAAFTVSLHCDGRRRETAAGARVLGGAPLALAALAALLREQGAAPLQAGEIVTTGTITAGYPVAAGQTWHTTLAGIELPGLAVEFT